MFPYSSSPANALETHANSFVTLSSVMSAVSCTVSSSREILKAVVAVATLVATFHVEEYDWYTFFDSMCWTGLEKDGVTSFLVGMFDVKEAHHGEHAISVKVNSTYVVISFIWIVEARLEW